MKENAVFADAFNKYIYKGEQVIKPENLKPLDTDLTVIPYGADGAGAPTQKYRDVLKSATVMVDDRAAYLLLGIESQSEVNHAMPVRNMVYDALQYAAQVEEAARSHREARKAGDPKELAKKPDGGEYLSGFYREDRLIPVITLAVYFGAGECQTSLREVMLFIKHSKDKTKLNEMVQKDDRFRNMDRSAARVVSSVTGVEINEENEEEKLDMCQALREMMEEANSEGRQEGAQDERIAMARRMLQEGGLSIDFIARMTGLLPEEVQALALEAM